MTRSCVSLIFLRSAANGSWPLIEQDTFLESQSVVFGVHVLIAMLHILLHHVIVHIEYLDPNWLDRRHTIEFPLLACFLALQYLTTNDTLRLILLVQIGETLFAALVFVKVGRHGVFKRRNSQPVDVELKRVLCYTIIHLTKNILTP